MGSGDHAEEFTIAVLTLDQALRARTMPADPALLERLPDGRIRCFACGHRCPISEGKAGVCKVRFVDKSVLHVPAGYVAALQCDPIEKKPFFHVLPGTNALSFGMLGCDLHCSYCQNWVTSQALRDPAAESPPQDITPAEIVRLAKRLKAPVVASTYNEPLITAEWAVQVFRACREAGLQTAFISNGNATREVLTYLRPWVEFYKVDLKGFDDKHYRFLGAPLQNILDGITMLLELGFWVEIVTLVIPGFNDSPDELRQIARFLAGLSKDIPWHVTAFHPDYKMTDRGATTSKHLRIAADAGIEAGLRFIYAGNLPGRVGTLENTYCPHCDALVVERVGYRILANRMAAGACPDCGKPVPGRWQG